MDTPSSARTEEGSPSMTLLMRLQQLRQWQEKQRENLQKSNSFQNSTSVNFSYESSLSDSPSNIPTSSVLHTEVSHSLNIEPSLTNEENTPSNLSHSVSYSSDSNNEKQLSCVPLKSSNLLPISTLNFDQNGSVSEISNFRHVQSSSHVSSSTLLKDSEFPFIDQFKKQEIKEAEENFFDSETHLEKTEDKGEECASDKYDSTAYLSFYSSDLNKKGTSLPVKQSPNVKKCISAGVSSIDDDLISNPISLKSTELEAPYVATNTNSPQNICNGRKTGYIKTRNRDSGNDQDQNENSEKQNKQSINGGCKEDDIEVNRIYKNHDNFDDIPIRTQSQNFQDILSKNLEGNRFISQKQSLSVPKFSFMKKGVGSAATQIKDIDSGFGSSSSVSEYAAKVESTTENKMKVKKTFLRKGQGTSRFGMKPTKLKILNSNTSFNESVPKELEYGQLKNIKKDKLVLENIRPQYHSNMSNFYDDKKQGIKQKFPGVDVPSTQYTNTNIQIYNNSQDLNISHRNNKTEKREVEELSAFEQLEELADESSFCSNSSTVIHLLQKGLRSASSTPIRSPAPFDFGESPISANHKNSSESYHNQELLSLSQVLEHCKALVQLEKEGNSNITQKDIDYLVESIISDQTVSVHSVSKYLTNLQQGTINVDISNSNGVHLNDDQKPRVHFRHQGVDVHEYDVLDSDSDTTLTDVQSIDEDVTDLVTTSDFEALAHLNLHGMLEHVPNRYDMREHVPEEVVDKSSVTTNRNMDMNKYLCELGRQNNFLKNSQKKGDSVQKVLEFSPPRQPPNSASHLVWSIFGQENKNKKSHQSKTSNINVVPNNEKECTQGAKKSLNVDTCEKDLKITQNSDKLEIDSHKTLLMAKICELEKETSTFQKKNNELKILQDSVKLDQENLSREKEDFKKQMTEHENKLREAINRERNRLWKERQELKQLNKEQITLESARTQSLEIVMLKEKLSDIEEEMKKKESSHQFSVRKLLDKIKSLEQENKTLKVDLCTLKTLEKENLNLKHKLDRGKLDSRTVLSNKAINKAQNLKKKVTIANAIKKSVEIRQKPKSINDINKELDKELLPNEEIDISIKDVYPSKNLNTKDIEKATVTTNSKNKLSVKEIKDLASFEGHHSNELESKTEKSLAVMEEADKSYEDFSSHPSPTTLINHGSLSFSSHPSTTTLMNHGSLAKKGISSDISRDMQQDIHSPGSVNIDYTENCKSDGTKEIIYANGNKKEIFPNGITVMNYYNGDCKEQHNDKTVYIYGTDQTKHISFTDGKEIVEFPNGQCETSYPDGSSEITFPDMSVKKISKDGAEICLMKDGTVVRTNPDGSKVFEFPSGQREIHSGDEKRREYPDGTVKILYDDGRVETRYKNGRIRIRDKQRNILTDTHG